MTAAGAAASAAAAGAAAYAAQQQALEGTRAAAEAVMAEHAAAGTLYASQDADEEAAAAAVHSRPPEIPGSLTAPAGWCAPADGAAPLPGEDDEETPEWARDDRGLTYRELLMVVAEELRFAPPEALDRPVRVDLGDSIDGIQSVLFDPDAGRLVVHPWLTRGVPRVALPAPGLHDFLIRDAAEAGPALKVLRLRRPMERAAITALTGVAPSTIGNIERGIDRPSPEMVIKLAQAVRAGVEIRDDADDKPDRPDFTLTHPSQVGPVLRALRLRRGVGVGVIALASNVSQRILRQYEEGTTMPTLGTFIRVLDTLDAVLAIADLDRRAMVS